MKKLLIILVSAFAFINGSAQIKISALPALSGLCDTCKTPVVLSGVTRKAGGNQIAWGLKGTTGSTAGTHYIGTTDAVAFVVKTNGSERLRILSSGEIGINTATPTTGFYLEVGSSDIIVNGIKYGRGGGSLSTNTRTGVQALDSNSTGQRNTAYGYQASLLISNGNSPVRNDNTSFGYQAMTNNYGSRVTAVGSFAVSQGGGADATGVGHNALLNARPAIGLASCGLAAFGKSALQNVTTGFNNTGLGLFAGCAVTTGTGNTAVGMLAMATGNSILGGTAALTGSNNTATGITSGYNLTGAAASNSFYGMNSGLGVTTGSGNTFIGTSAGSSSTTVNNAVIIGSHTGSGITDNQIAFSDGAGILRFLINNVGSATMNGSLSLATAGNKINIATGANASVGTATLSSGTVTVNTTAVTASSVIFLQLNTPSGTLAIAYAVPVGSIVAATSFVINAVDAAGAVLITDNSTVNWWIVN